MSLGLPTKIDLHCHSHYSDGSLSPQELIDRAHNNSVEMLAITDHDSVEAVKELWDKKAELPLTLIPAVEVSSSWEGRDIHIVGLNVDHQHPEFVQFLEQQFSKRHERGLLLIEKLEARLKIEQVAEKIAVLAKGGIVCRSHFAQLLVDEDRASDIRRAFSKFLAKGKIAAVTSNWPDISESIAQITGCGGIAVLAHPTRYKLSNSRLYALIEQFSRFGGGALEMAYPGIDKAQQRRLARIAREFGLAASRGSDFHHPWQVWADLGKVPPLPADVKVVWEAFISKSPC